MRIKTTQDLINKTRDYLDYIEEHYQNVLKSWRLVKDKCENMRFMYDDFYFFTLDANIKQHDFSKLSKEEFTQYRQFFHPLYGETKNKEQFEKAWEHHKKENGHHWQNWILEPSQDQELYIVEMAVDWMAMGLKFGDTAREYYDENKDKIKLPEWADRFVNEIFDAVYDKHLADTEEG